MIDRVEQTTRITDLNVNIRLARSCFAALFIDAYEESQSQNVDLSVFHESVQNIMDNSALEIFDAVDNTSSQCGKRQPSLRESLSATVDRLDVLRQLEGVFNDSASAIIYGGSMKYGPFMNVRSGADGSDLDLLIVIDENVPINSTWQGLMNSTVIDEPDKLTFFARLGIQSDLYEANQADIMSQRFNVANKGYTISSHIVPMNFINEMYPQSSNSIETTTNRHKYIRDYKERPFERPQVTNYDMSGELYGIKVYNKPVDGGFVASNPAYSVLNNRYIPGMYQNLALPIAKYAYDSSGKTTKKFLNFAKFAVGQEQREKMIYTNTSILNTEPRKQILPIDVNDILPK